MSESYVLLKTYHHLHEAEQDLNTLKNEEIDAYLTDRNMGSISFLGAGTGGIKMHVAERDLARAKSLLDGE